jgi:hypothetical protein
MLIPSNSDPVPLDCVMGFLRYTSVVIGARERGLLNKRIPLLLGVKYGHKKLWITSFDSKRRLLGRVVRFVSRLQLSIDSNVKRFGKGRFAGFSNRSGPAIGNGSPCLPRSIRGSDVALGKPRLLAYGHR